MKGKKYGEVLAAEKYLSDHLDDDSKAVWTVLS